MRLMGRLFLHAVNFFSFPLYVHPGVSLRMCLPLFPRPEKPRAAYRRNWVYDRRPWVSEPVTRGPAERKSDRNIYPLLNVFSYHSQTACR